MKPWVDRVVDWHGWRLLIPLAVVLLLAVVFYTGYSVHQHSNQLNCLTHGLDQILNEALRHAKLTPPPNC